MNLCLSVGSLFYFYFPLYLHLNVAYPPSSSALLDKKPFVKTAEELCMSSLIFFFIEICLLFTQRDILKKIVKKKERKQ